MKDIGAFDLRIGIGDGWIAVHDDAGNTLFHERAEIDGWPVASRGIVAAIEPLRTWMEMHLLRVVEEHEALLVAVSPNITDPECRSIRACLSTFSPLLVGFIQLPVAAAESRPVVSENSLKHTDL